MLVAIDSGGRGRVASRLPDLGRLALTSAGNTIIVGALPEVNRVESGQSRGVAQIMEAEPPLAVIAPPVAITGDAELAADFRALFDAADVGIARIDATTRVILESNARFSAMLGYANGELAGRTTDALTHPDDAATGHALYDAIVATGSGRSEARLLARNGDALWVRVEAVLIADADGVTRRAIALVHDLTPAKIVAAKAFDDQERTHLALEAATAGAWEYRIADQRLMWSPELRALYNLPVDMPPPNFAEWCALIHPDDLDRVMPRAEDFGASDNYATEFRVRAGDGWRWLGARGRILRDTAGVPQRLVGINIDLTEPRAAAEATALSAGRFRAAVEAMSGVLWTNSPDGRMSGVQQGWAALTGQPEDAYQGYGWADAIHPDDAPGTIAAWQAAVAATAPFAFEHRVRTAAGDWRWFAVRAVPVVSGGRLIEWVGVHTDIDAARTAEADLKARVAAAVGARETALAQLHEVQKLETIGQLTGGVAHDFNNLLTPIIGTLDLLQRRQPDPRNARLIDGALVAADRARVLVQRLLAFSRRQSLEARAVDVAALVAGLHELLQGALGPTITLVVSANGDVPPAQVDPIQLELALLNLAVNARDAMPEGGTVSIDIAMAQAAAGADIAPGDYVRLTIADTGTGMDDATRRRAIEPFFSTKGVGRGAGLGLSMVHGLAAQSGGKLVLDSVPDRGTRAELWLPAATGSASHAHDSAVTTATSDRQQRILLVDDEATVRSATAAMLTDLGYTVVEAGDAHEALALIGEVPGFDLVITDYLMPGINGAELVQTARTVVPQLPALVVTGFADADSFGPDLPWLAKPFRHAELGRIVATLLSPAATG